MLPGKKLSITYFLEVARRRFWLIAIPPAITFFAALVYSSTIPNVYESDMLIAIDPQRVPDAFVRSTVTLETERRMEALIIKVLSRTSLQQLIEKFDLYKEERRTQPIEDVAAKMRSDIRVPLEIPRPRWGETPQPTAFRVRFVYPDPGLSAKVAQEIGGLFVESNMQERGALAGATSQFLETQLAESRVQLVALEHRLEEFRQRHGKELPTQMTSNMNALTNAQLQAQSLVESIARDRDRRQMLERLYREAAAEPVVVPPTTPAASPTTEITLQGSAQQQLVAARASLAALRLRYMPDHPDVARAERRVADLEPRAAAEERAAKETTGTAQAAPEPVLPGDSARRESLRQMRAEIESLERQMTFKETEERRVRGDIAEYQRRIEAVPGLESDWVALTRDYDTQQLAYKDLLAKSASARVAANLEKQDIGESFRVVDPAVVPVRPVPSIRARNNAIGLALGLMFGFGLAALLELRDSSFRTDGEVLDVLLLPVLASVPRVETSTEKVRRTRWRITASLVGATSVAFAGYVTWMLKLWNSLI
jgi:polysaccharide chain length determinant protein (PEP-CTERM system associated)